MSDDGYVSPIDGHSHFAVRNRQECAVCMLELERDAAMRVLREFVERVATAAGVSLVWDDADRVGEPGTAKYNDRLISEVEAALADRDQLRAALSEALNSGTVTVEPARWSLERDELVAERDRFRAGLRLIAIPPVHVPDLSEGCEGCAGVARAALDGTDYQGRVATILANEMATVQVIQAAKRWYDASDMDELQHAVAALKAAVKSLGAKGET